jgi:glutathione synthase/RimK-type ligase-like ATP-grasp enzyme
MATDHRSDAMTVLILGFPHDIHIHAVRWALDQVGVGHHVLYTPDMPNVLRASVRVSAGMPGMALFRSGPIQGTTGSYDTVWYRRSGEAMRPAKMSEPDWTVANRECDHHIRTLRRCLAPNAYWVNDIEAREQARLKVLQLIAASACGLAIPETLFSNDPEEIRRFYAEHRRQRVIFKLNVQTYWAGPNGASHVLFTTALRDEDLIDDEALSSCPAIYQRKIEKEYELRVTCMDERCFCVRLDSQSRDITRTDWRADLCAPLKPRLHELPPQVEERCIMLMRKLGLAFGCIDLIVTPQGEHVFLEVNEMGQFLWVEQDEPGCPMLHAFASLLIQHRLDRSSRLVGSDRISFGEFLKSGTWERACADDDAHHTRYDALRAVNEP